MLRILSWSSGLGCDKVHTPEFDMFVPQENAAPVASLPMCPSVKRKRSPSLDAFADRPRVKSVCHQPVAPTNVPGSQPDVTRHHDSIPMSSPVPHRGASDRTSSSSTGTMDKIATAPVSPSTSPTRMDKVRQVISSQLSLEILLKHKELRLIEQEMAKCQIALEQLRRCTEIPFPATQQPSSRVSEGTGPAVRRLGERYPPESPAPWGVTDGPYSRHYAKWLLPDRRFDGGEPEPDGSPVASKTPASGRSTRGYYVDVLAGKTVKPRARNSANLQALPAGYGQPREKATGPMILKRKSDGATVKLVCPDCSRHDFGSAQGFINHCRIGHSRSFASHDAAAEACGEPVEYNENGTIKGVEPTATTTPSAINVHALVRSAKLLSQTPTIAPHLRGGYFPSPPPTAKSAHGSVSPDFHASPQAPHLSALVQGRGFALDLHHLVAEAQTPADPAESDHEDDEMDVHSPFPVTGGRHPQVAGSKQPLKSSAVRGPSHPQAGSTRSGGHVPELRSVPTCRSSGSFVRDSFTSVLPSPTNESTQAPSLVDDDDDFDPQSPMSHGDVDEADVHFEVHDDDHGDRMPRMRELAGPQPTCSPPPPAAIPGATIPATDGSDGRRGKTA